MLKCVQRSDDRWVVVVGGRTHLWVGPEEGRMGGWGRTGRQNGGGLVGTFSGEEAAEEAVKLEAVWVDLSNHMNEDA